LQTKPGCYVSDVKDIVKTPGTYITAEQRDKERLEKVPVLFFLFACLLTYLHTYLLTLRPS